jgi:hypothetical protein
MPIPQAHSAMVTTAKVRDYLLNPDHPDGGAKAVWFHSLGYVRDRWRELAGDLLAVARDCGEFATDESVFGVKYVARGQVGRLSHPTGDVLTVWIVEGELPPRLVTAYPDDAR